MNRTLRLIFRVMAVMFVATAFGLGLPAQEKGSGKTMSISGVVTDNTGIGLPGANVLVVGSKNWAITDAKGAYSVQARQGDALEFSFIGMLPQTVTVGTSTVINVRLEDDTQMLEEAVSIGYGTQNRSLVTTSITRVSSEEFEHTPQQSPLAQLQGKVPGLQLQVTSGQPGENPEIFLRGGTTTGTSSDAPLIIVDGAVSQGMRAIQDMNPSDIESIEVLKDAASTSIYGARAANGIIIITTKQGSEGNAKVNFRYTFGLDQQPKRLNLLNARDYIYLTRKAAYEDPNATEADKNKFLNGSFGMSTGNAWDSPNTLEFLDVYLNNYGQDFVADLLENKGWETMVDPATGKQLIFMDTDFQDATYHNAVKNEYELSISGGDKKLNYYGSLRYLDQDGIVRGTWYKNYSASMNASYQINKNWKVFSKATFNVGDRNTMANSVNSLQRAMFMPPTYKLRYEDGSPAPGEGMSSFRPREYENYYKTRYTVNKQYRTSMQGGAVWTILPGLTFSPTIYYMMSQGINGGFEAMNETTGTAIRPASGRQQHDGHFQADAVLNFDKSFARHHINATAGASYIKDDETYISGSGSGASTDLIPTLNATADSTQRVTSIKTAEAMLSYFGRVNYDYDGKYLASISMRADGSSRFAENHRWGYFPGASLGWNAHKEAFFKPLRKYFSKLKLRTSWGRTGNNSISLSDSRGLYGITGTTYLGEVGILNTTLANADLVWETTESWDAGLDLGFFNNRLEILVDVYNKKTFDRLYDNKLPSTTGFSSIKCNYGSLGTKGIEVEINAVPVSTKDFTWSLGANFTWYRTIVLSQPENGEEKNRTGGNYIYDPTTGTEIKVGGFAEGERFGSRYAYHYLGVYQTDEEAALAPYDENAKGRTKHAGDAIWEDRNNDGYINAKDMIFMGYIRPDKTGGFTNSFRWKNLTARVVADFAMGHVINNGSLAYGLASIRNNYNTYTEALKDCWTPENPNAKYPRFSPLSDADYATRNFTRSGESIGSSTSGQSNNSAFYQKGDFLAIREISLAYNLPKSLTKMLRISALQIFGGVYNVGYITGYDGMTPELYLGYDYGQYPRPREYSMGVNITF